VGKLRKKSLKNEKWDHWNIGLVFGNGALGTLEGAMKLENKNMELQDCSIWVSEQEHNYKYIDLGDDALGLI